MKQLFAVTRNRGTAWKKGRPLEEQEEWTAHAAFMNGLQAERFVVLGGPLEGGPPDVLLIVRADDETAIRAKLAVDPWTRNGLLLDPQILPWTIRLGSLGS